MRMIDCKLTFVLVVVLLMNYNVINDVTNAKEVFLESLCCGLWLF